MARAPKVPPIAGWFDVVKDAKGNITDVKPSQALYKLIVGEYDNVGSVNSGVSQARADAAAAQATAEAAAQTASDVAADALAFSAAVSPALASGTRLGTGNVTTNSVTVTPTGGTAPYTYAWALVSGDTFTINSPTSATTTFTINITAAGQDKSATYRCTVTDSLAATCSVTVGVSASELS